ncbi:MAG: isoleucine--tRNA ligase [Bacteroidetes bacterium]|nr:isoleucine--tRNA ligase [Bacteroidota bacterium]MDA1085206.1 isoleucine--tRNA ligase [Bacteroidota bacterium]
MFPTYSHLDLTAAAEEIASFWDEHLVFEASIDTREGRPPFVFFEGPPSANGLPGIHHVLARALKDIFCRYKTQQGFQVKRKAGWDTHGLPVELGVEKELGITKEDIGKTISVSEYNNACKEAVMRYTDVWNDLTKKMGYWVDMDDPYITYTAKYMESVWWLLATLYQKELIYKGYTIQPYSPMAGTGLSSHELNQPGCYRDVTDTSVTAQFKTKKDSLPEALKGEVPLHILAWTTTPWTLPSNTALTVGPKISYVVIQTFNQYTYEPVRVLLAKKLIGKQFGKKYAQVEAQNELATYDKANKTIPFWIEQEIMGTDLVGIQYEQLWTEAPLPYQNPEDAFRIIAGDFVTTDDGTGIVHTAPTFGADDAKVAKEATPPIPPLLILDENENPVPLVDLQGKFRTEVGSVGGKFVKDEYYPEGEVPEKSADVEIAIRLKEENKAFKVEKYVHSYPHCWRTDAPVLYYPLDSWFIKVQDHKGRMVELNQTIQWKPAKTGEGRFGNWLANANDWNLSRSRFWGIPLPIWRTSDGDETRVIGSVEELKTAVDDSVPAGLMMKNPLADFVPGDMSERNYERVDLHKDTVDELVLLSESGKPMYRESDLIDVWFDSGAMPYAQWHYPFENKEKIDGGTTFPADYIAEGVDQTRGWFYTLHTIATLVFDSVAYKNVVSNGLVLDKNGQKMSKRLGNAVDPFETLNKYGPDATRWYMISNANPWDNLKFDLEGIEEVRRKFFGTLYNTYSFFSLYANIDGFIFAEDEIPISERPEIDQWILSELHSLIENTTQFYDAYEPTRACRAISHFVTEDLSNWYVRLCRRRFWKGSYEIDKIAAYQTLYECLMSVAKMMAPVAPFYADRLYQDLNSITKSEQASSVHLAFYPKSTPEIINPLLEQKMQRAQKITSLVLSLRKREKIKVRQPLQRIMIPVLDKEERKQVEAVSALIAAEVNVKEVEILDDTSSILVKEIKPNFKTLGPRFGKDMKLVAQAIQNLNEGQIQELEKQGVLTIQLDNKKCILEATDVVISSKDVAGWLVASEQGVTVALDVQMNETLRLEGMARELVNRLQNMRKDLGFEVTDTIQVTLQESDELNAILNENKAYIQHEILATTINVAKVVSNEAIELMFDSLQTQVEMVKS